MTYVLCEGNLNAVSGITREVDESWVVWKTRGKDVVKVKGRGRKEREKEGMTVGATRSNTK